MSIDLAAIAAAVTAALPIARMLAGLTATKWDDKAVEVLAAIAANETLLQFLQSLINAPKVAGAFGEARTDAIMEAVGEAGTPEVKAAAEAAGISWTTLIVYAPTIVRLVLTVLGLRS